MYNNRLHPTTAFVTPVACATAAPNLLRRPRLQVKQNVRLLKKKWSLLRFRCCHRRRILAFALCAPNFRRTSAVDLTRALRSLGKPWALARRGRHDLSLSSGFAWPWNRAPYSCKSPALVDMLQVVIVMDNRRFFVCPGSGNRPFCALREAGFA